MLCALVSFLQSCLKTSPPKHSISLGLYFPVNFGQNPVLNCKKQTLYWFHFVPIRKTKCSLSFRLWNNHIYHIIYYIKMYLKIKVTIFVEGPMMKNNKKLMLKSAFFLSQPSLLITGLQTRWLFHYEKSSYVPLTNQWQIGHLRQDR